MNGRAEYWDKRSKDYGEKIEGVLFKSFPLTFNKYLHNWMVSFILDEIDKENKKINILDLGCGYGRIASELVKHNKKNKVYGLDISKTYVSLFNKNLKPFGKAWVGDVKKLPFKKGQFDLVLSITTLMYMLNKKEKDDAVSEMTRVTRKGGKIILIEPNPIGKSFITLGGLLKKTNNNIKLSVDYNVDEVEKLFGKKKWIINRKFGMPTFTIALLPLLATYKISPSLTSSLLKLVREIDKRLSWITIPSLYVVYIGYEK